MGTITIVTIIIIEGSAYRKFIVFSFWTPTSLSCNIKMPVLYSMCHTIWCPSLSLRVLLPLLFCRETLDPSWSPFLLPSSMSPSLWFLILCLQTSTNLSLKKKRIKWPNCPFIELSCYLSPSFTCQTVFICGFCLHCYPFTIQAITICISPLLLCDPILLNVHSLRSTRIDFSCFSRPSSNYFYNNNHVFIF